MGVRKWIKWWKIYFQMLFLKFVRIFRAQTIFRENKVFEGWKSDNAILHRNMKF